MDDKNKGTPFGELFTRKVNTKKPIPRQFAFTDQQIEVAKRWARGDSYSKICGDLGIKHPSQIANTLRDFKPTAEMMWKVVKELREAGYWRKSFKKSGRVKEYVSRGREARKQMLREGLWPFPRHSIPWGYTYDVKEKMLMLDVTKKDDLKEYFTRCANGEVPHAVATKLKIPHGSMYGILENPIYKGYANFTGELFPFKHLAVVDEETWDRAQEARMEIKRSERKPGLAPLGTKWVGNKLVPHDPENKIGQLVQLRLKKYGRFCIAKELRVSALTVERALKRDHLYIDLGMVDPDVWEKVQKIHVGREEYHNRRAKEIEAKILLYLGKYGPSTTRPIAKATKLSECTVRKYLQGHKDLVDREPKQFGKWYLQEKIKPKVI